MGDLFIPIRGALLGLSDRLYTTSIPSDLTYPAALRGHVGHRPYFSVGNAAAVKVSPSCYLCAPLGLLPPEGGQGLSALFTVYTVHVAGLSRGPQQPSQRGLGVTVLLHLPHRSAHALHCQCGRAFAFALGPVAPVPLGAALHGPARARLCSQPAREPARFVPRPGACRLGRWPCGLALPAVAPWQAAGP